MPNPFTGDPKNFDPEKDFHSELSGHCLCNSIPMTTKDQELFSKRRGHLWHCANCRKASGSLYGANLIIEEEKVTIEDRNGTLKDYMDYEPSGGTPMTRSFCSTCGKYMLHYKSPTPLLIID